MRFGVIKTLVENKLIKSFVDKKLGKDMKLFESKILKDKSFARLYFIYDTLKENKSLDKETALYMIDDLVNESKNLKISDKTMEEIVKWTKGLVKENNYTIIDDLIYGDELKPEKKSIAKKNIVESLMKSPVIKEEKKPVPIKSMIKIANNTVNKALEELNESDREKVVSILKSEKTKESYNSLKESTISKIDSLISESEDEMKSVLTETKERIQNTEYSKKEYIKLLQLNQGL